MNPDTKPSESADVEKAGVEREALAESERQAAKSHPDNYKEAATDTKVVEIGPDLTDAPIEGIDPAEVHQR